jgi:hypothetical protein
MFNDLFLIKKNHKQENKMRAECTDNKTFQLIDNGHLLGKLTYKSLFSYDAEINLANSECYELKSAGFFGTKIIISKNETEIANLQMNWKGQMVFTFQDGQEFVFKAKGVFHNSYVIEDKAEEKLIQVDPKFNWGKFHYNYEISYSKKPENTLFILIGIYASNYYLSAMSGQL